MTERHFAHWPQGVPRHMTLPQRSMFDNLALTAAQQGDRPAIRYFGRVLTYSDLLEKVEALAGWLQAHGVAKGDRVLLAMQNAPQFVISYYAIMRADAVVVPVNPMSRGGEIDWLVRDTGAKLAIIGTELAPHWAEAGLPLLGATYATMADPDYDLPLPKGLEGLTEPAPGTTGFNAALAEGHVPGPHTAGPDDLALIPYSSGTTGQPKGCMHTHRSVMATAWGGILWTQSEPTDVVLATLPLFHVTGMQNSMNGPIITGGQVVLMTRWDRRIAAALIPRYKVNRWRSITTMAIDLVNDPDLDPKALSSLEAIGGGGAAMPAAIAARLKTLTGLDYLEGYGLSETMAATHINPPDAPRAQCLGIPVMDVDSEVIDPETLRPLGPDEVGEIVMRGPQVFQGYWRNPEATKAAFVDIDGKTFFRSGDIGRCDADGFFYMVDRLKRMVNASGFKVWPAEVEALMHGHPGIAEVCVIGAPDPRRGETVKAVIVRRDPALDAEGVIRWCHANMAAYKCPTLVDFVDALPKSGTGKVLWRELTEKERAAS
ncbi:long-chain-fatty-acid--CoA ligase [Mesobacterium pallidum]|uniref:long-chain-fatty-acid--CoA ligase n=1 Tax=Mesobacterium pallidum TaxID=2872037 RepID=UPI001EE291D0|nr:long-chain-fatty-acid--CoA ligase [Mesobacterium pallidum]